MTASVAVSNSGKIEYEPTEITKRTITYYLIDERGAPDASGTPRVNATVAPVAEGDKVSKRAEAKSSKQAEVSAAEKPQAILQNSPAAEGAALLNVGVLNNRTTELPQPARPVGRKRLDEPITVSVEVVVDITGRVVSARAPNAPDALRKPSESAARRAVFLPFYVGGRPVRARGLINYTFDSLP
jgi:hypothetical protein